MGIIVNCMKCGQEVKNPDNIHESSITPNKLIGTCDRCHSLRKFKDKMQNEQYGDNIICPGCGTEWEDAECDYVNSDGEEFYCEECDTEFLVSGIVEISYRTWKPVEDTEVEEAMDEYFKFEPVNIKEVEESIDTETIFSFDDLYPYKKGEPFPPDPTATVVHIMYNGDTKEGWLIVEKEGHYYRCNR